VRWVTAAAPSPSGLGESIGTTCTEGRAELARIRHRAYDDCGRIVIAISLEHAVESIHWHNQVHTACDVLRQELLEANGFYEFRVAVNQCAAQRLSQLNDVVESAAEHANLEPVGDLSLHIGHLLTDDAWQSERAAQTLVHFPAAERYRKSVRPSQWPFGPSASISSSSALPSTPGERSRFHSVQ
jgi:hypothetical protein